MLYNGTPRQRRHQLSKSAPKAVKDQDDRDENLSSSFFLDFVCVRACMTETYLEPLLVGERGGDEDDSLLLTLCMFMRMPSIYADTGLYKRIQAAH